MKNENKSIGDLMGEMKVLADELLANKTFPVESYGGRIQAEELKAKMQLKAKMLGIRSIADGWFQDQALKAKMLERYKDLMDIEKVGFRAANRVMETTYPDGWKENKTHTWECYDNMGDII